jgi:hypothetical protein
VMVPEWPAVGRVRVEVGNQITRRMTRLPSGESCGGEPEPNPLGLGFVKFGVGEGGSALWYGATVNEVMPSGGLANSLRSTCVLGM